MLLVTSALHMARAELEFRRQGFVVIATPVDYSIEPLTGWQNYLPSTAVLDGNASAFKELLGRHVWNFFDHTIASAMPVGACGVSGMP